MKTLSDTELCFKNMRGEPLNEVHQILYDYAKDVKRECMNAVGAKKAKCESYLYAHRHEIELLKRGISLERCEELLRNK